MKISRINCHWSLSYRRRTWVWQDFSNFSNGRRVWTENSRVWTINRSPHGNKTSRDQYSLGRSRSQNYIGGNLRWVLECVCSYDTWVVRSE